jgi:hypothetical protein
MVAMVAAGFAAYGRAVRGGRGRIVSVEAGAVYNRS